MFATFEIRQVGNYYEITCYIIIISIQNCFNSTSMSEINEDDVDFLTKKVRSPSFSNSSHTIIIARKTAFSVNELYLFAWPPSGIHPCCTVHPRKPWKNTYSFAWESTCGSWPRPRSLDFEVAKSNFLGGSGWVRPISPALRI